MPIELNKFYAAYMSLGISYYDYETNTIVNDKVNIDKLKSLVNSGAECETIGHFVRNQKPSGAYNPPRYLLIPKFDAKEPIYRYIDQVADESYKVLLDLSGDDIIHAFHVKVTDDGLYEDWIEFQYNVIINLAAEWCNQHNIEYYRTQIEWE